MRWDEMSMSQKSEAIGLMVRNGVTDIGTMKQMWDDMDGRKKQKPSYAEWVKGVNPQFIGPDYNLKAAYDELPFETMEAWRRDPNANHLPDTYKLPSHPTFSLESKDPVTSMKGGAWLGDRFYPSQTNRIFNPDMYSHSGAYLELPYGNMVPETIQLPQPTLSFAEGGFASPDHDPNNPYHYHVNGKKVIVTPEDWEKYKDDPTFREVRAAIEAEQAAYPEPEYDEVPNPAWRKAYQNLVNGVNLRGRSNYLQSLPQGYTRDTKGIPMDSQGNYYLPVETATDAPYFINQERGMMGHIVPVRYEQQQMPDRTIRQLRQPLPVDRVMNVGEERENAIDNYMANNFVPTLYKRRGHDIYSSNPNVPGWTIWNGDNKIPRNILITDGNGQALYLTGQKYMGEDAYEMAFEEEDPIGYKNLLQKYKGNIIKIPNPTGSLRYSLFDNPDYGTSDLTGAMTDEILRKGKNPTNQEAEKKAVIKVGDLEKVGIFAEGGSPDDPPEPFLSVPLGYDNNIYKPTYGSVLPEVRVVAKGDPRKVNNDYYKAHAAERADFEDKVANRVDQGWVPQTMLGLASVPLDVEGLVGLRLLYEQLPKWVLNVPKNPNRYYRIVDKRAIDDYISSGKIRSAQAAKEAGVDTEGPKQAGRILLKKNHDYNMFSKGEPWQGGLAIRDNNKPYILVSKENTGKTIWEQSNVDFRHKGHSGIYRPRYEGDLDATPSIYFDYYKPKLIGYTKHSFDEGGSPDDPPYFGYPVGQPEGPIDYLNRYVQSKAFERRAPDADYLNTARQNVDSFEMVYNDPIPKRMKNYSPFYANHYIQMYPGGMETPYAPYKQSMMVPYMAILAHEYGHNIDPYFNRANEIPDDWMALYEQQSREANDHDSRPQEMYADLQSLRYQLYEKNIYDIINDGAFNEKHYFQALKQNIPNRLLRTMPKKILIEMMNTIADNSQPTDNTQDAYILPTDVGLGYV